MHGMIGSAALVTVIGGGGVIYEHVEAHSRGDDRPYTAATISQDIAGGFDFTSRTVDRYENFLSTSLDSLIGPLIKDKLPLPDFENAGSHSAGESPESDDASGQTDDTDKQVASKGESEEAEADKKDDAKAQKPNGNAGSADPIDTGSGTDTTPGWLSGAASKFAADGSFGEWRGSKVEIGGTWIDNPAVYPLGPKIAGCGGCGEWENFVGAMDIAVTPPNKEIESWAAEAAGAHDEHFRQTFRAIKKAREGKGQVFLRIWHEYNGHWYDYSVRTQEDAKHFKTAFNNVATIAREEIPEAKIMLSTGAAHKPGYPTVAETYPDDSLVDGLSVDFYNEWDFCTDQACFDKKIEDGGGLNSLADLQRLGKKHGDPILISEWSNHGGVRPQNEGGGGESPGFMRAWHSWLKKNAGNKPGQVLGEVQFNLWPDKFEFFDGASSRLHPQTVEEYRRLW